MRFPRKLTNGVKSPSQRLIERKNYNDGNSSPNQTQIYFPVNLLMVTLYPSCEKALFVSSRLSSINAWILSQILEEKMRGGHLSFLECAPCLSISWCVMRWSDAPASLVKDEIMNYNEGWRVNIPKELTIFPNSHTKSDQGEITTHNCHLGRCPKFGH
jgi:hypothetical protein